MSARFDKLASGSDVMIIGDEPNESFIFVVNIKDNSHWLQMFYINPNENPIEVMKEIKNFRSTLSSEHTYYGYAHSKIDEQLIKLYSSLGCRIIENSSEDIKSLLDTFQLSDDFAKGYVKVILD